MSVKFIISAQDLEETQRLDSVLSRKLGVSKSQIAQGIKGGRVKCNGVEVGKAGFRLREGDELECGFGELGGHEEREKAEFEGEIAVLFEDEDVLVLNKPPHLVIHEAPSVREATLVDYLKSRGYRLSTLSGEERYGIIHRLDKPTSGAIAIAKTNFAHKELSSQLQNRQMGRYYLAIVDLPLRQKLQVECQMGRNPRNRLKMAKLPIGRYSKTEFIPLELPLSSTPPPFASLPSPNPSISCASIPKTPHAPRSLGLVAAKLFTGRTHQIRLHLETLSRHIIGDPLYGKQDSWEQRLMLHAYILYFIHPRTQKRQLICAPLFEDMLGFLQKSFALEAWNDDVAQRHILHCFGDDI